MLVYLYKSMCNTTMKEKVYHVESGGGCSGVISICEGLEGWKVMGKWCNSISIKTYVLKVKREQK